MSTATDTPPVGPYALPELKFGYADLEPIIDEATMRLHHDKHHRAYVDGVNDALSNHPEWLGMTVEALLGRLSEVPEDIRVAVRNQGGGHANHQFFWKILTPNSPAAPPKDLAQAIARDFGSFDAFKTRFHESASEHFGSGWAFLVADPKNDFHLKIVTLPNQDSVIEVELPALLLCDLWEHAYYLQYHDRRPEWIKKWWDIVNWDYVGERLQGIREGRKSL